MSASLLGLLLALASAASALEERLVLHTAYGNLVARLDASSAPESVAQVLALARAGAYDGSPVSRVKPGYLVQFGGARVRRGGAAAAWRTSLKRLPLETGRLRHRRGTLTLSRREDDPDSAESSFSILLRDAPHLDGRYAAIGTLEEGWEALEALAALPLEPDGRPRHWTEITRAEVVDAADVGAALERWPEARGRRPTAELAGLVALIVLLSAGAALAEGRVPGRPLRAACLLNALVGFFAVLTALGPQLPARGWTGAALFGCALAVFRLLAAFEPPVP